MQLNRAVTGAQNKYIDGLRSWRVGMEVYSTGLRLWQWGRSALGYTVSVPAQDWIYDEVHAWLLQTAQSQGKQRIRSTIAYTGRTSRGGYIDEFGEPTPDVKFYSDDHRVQKITLDGHRIEVSLLKPDHNTSLGNMSAELARSLERIQFSCLTLAARDAVIQLLSELVQNKARGDHTPQIRIVSRWGDWQNCSDVGQRTKDSVILREGQADALFSDMDDFLKAEPDYVKRCLPYHRGYLLYGPPGSGKTSIVKALATEFGLDLWYLPLGDISKDTNLLNLIGQVEARSILLLEDVDVFDVAHSRETDDNEGEVSLSGLLNALDGVATPHGLITILTTNKFEVLDDALVRTGRVDRTEFIDYADSHQVEKLFEFFYEQPLNKPFEVKDNVAPSDLLEVMKRHMNDPVVAERLLRSDFGVLRAA